MPKKVYQQVFIGLGSNLSSPKKQVELAINNLKNTANITLIKSSSLYNSKPQGPQNQPDFVNAVVQIETNLNPYELLAKLQNMELEQGKTKIRHWGERLIDLDILLFANQNIKTDKLTISHPYMHLRDFVLIPLLELDPNILIPGKGLATTCLQALSHQFIKN